MLGSSLSYPPSGDGGWKTVLVGGLLLLLGVLIVPFVLVLGYMVRVLRSASADERGSPAFGDWGALFVDGIKLFVVQLVYVLVPIALLVVAVTIIGVGLLAESGLASAVGGIGGVLLFLVSLALVVFAVYLVPAAMANLAYHDSLAAGFDVRTVLNAAFSVEYFGAFLLAFLLWIVVGTVAAVLSLVLIGFFLQFYVLVAVFYLFGRGYAKGLGLDQAVQAPGATAV